jgi:hypothetical protein
MNADRPELAQCATCGGELVPAGDDWTHRDDTGCTLYGEPVLCGRGECAYPAVIGGTACQGCTGTFLPARYTATVVNSGHTDDERGLH